MWRTWVIVRRLLALAIVAYGWGGWRGDLQGWLDMADRTKAMLNPNIVYMALLIAGLLLFTGFKPWLWLYHKGHHLLTSEGAMTTDKDKEEQPALGGQNISIRGDMYGGIASGPNSIATGPISYGQQARTLIGTDGKAAVERLRPYAGTALEVSDMNGDGESFLLGNQILNLFRAAGWRPDPDIMGRGHSNYAPRGVLVQVPKGDAAAAAGAKVLEGLFDERRIAYQHIDVEPGMPLQIFVCNR